MAGRSGAAFAAQLGSMTASQEVDALTTLGISPIEFLVLPRVAALVLMMPILAVFADAVSILGGATVGAVMLDIELPRYLRQTAEAVAVKHLLGGLFKAMVYGGLVALAGCLRGLTSGRSAADVGNAVTSAVVTSIILIIGAAGLFAVLFNALHL
jgi:phospholipid/cholesterol/gamma-HCH transport system permease protein